MGSDSRRLSDSQVERTLHATIVCNNLKYFPHTQLMREKTLLGKLKYYICFHRHAVKQIYLKYELSLLTIRPQKVCLYKEQII